MRITSTTTGPLVIGTPSMSNPQVRPLHTHDSEESHFLGRVGVDSQSGYDVWFDEENEDLILRFGSEGPEYECFPLGIARIMGTVEGVGEHKWSLAYFLADQWIDAGRPLPDLMDIGDKFFDHFTLAVRVETEAEEDGSSGVNTWIYGLSERVRVEHVEHFISSRHPLTHCQHEHDCCGHFYTGGVSWEYIPGTKDRALKVVTRFHQNI